MTWALLLKAYLYAAPILLLLTLSLCKAARRGDDMAEAAHKQFLRDQGRA